MNPDKSPLVSKLTLLVLSLILVCLVLLVLRAYQRPSPPDVPAEVAETTTPSVEHQPQPIEPPASQPEPPRRPTTTNRLRTILSPGPAPSPGNDPSPGADASGQTPATPDSTASAYVGVAESIVASGGGGEIAGFATLNGTPKPEIPIDLGPICGAHNPGPVTTRHYVVGPNRGLANVFVYVKNANAVGLKAPPVETPLLDQIGCMYEPYVLGIAAGQKFRIRNSDPVLHNVHATPTLNREFNFGQTHKGQVNEKSFSTPEMFVRIKCDVHPWMFAYVSVMEHPFFAITDTNGFFRLPARFPAGNYIVAAAHLKTTGKGELIQEIAIKEGEQKTLKFDFILPPASQPQGNVVGRN